ncbi:hypothetical protein [Ralstonia insidiosa]|uniref:Poly(3-hydroxyalkanoate) polymerase subunit PhaE n=1 Tax=Ralstonia insidiosa TaxID=190721 RepID=A0A848P080_9RALS|nr:hypothetical protein [Ralstonia insidiosa]NMV38094.1 hypothetical protein [Ralstonia insidiosa]
MTQDKSDNPPASAASPFLWPLLLDPVEIWRQALTQFEQQANALGNQWMRSPDFPKAMHKLSQGSLQYRTIVKDVLTWYLKVCNLPSRKDLEALAEALRTIDGKLEQLLSEAQQAQQAPQAPRPSRGRRQPTATVPSTSVESPVDLAATPATSKRKTPARKSAAARKPKER